MPIHKTLTFEIKQVGPPEDRTLRFIGSTEDVDRDNDIIEVAGWKLDNYLKNPVFLWCHDYSQPPIGKAVNVVADVNNKQLLFDIKFASADEYPFADTIYKLYLGGYMRATSVGFTPIKYKRRDDDAVLDQPEWRRGTRYVEQELLELSAVPVPSNPQALIQARSKGINTTPLENFFVDDKTADDLREKAQKLLNDLGFETRSMIVDGKEKQVTAYVEDGTISLSFSALEGRDGSIFIQPASLFLQQKAGATLSTKNAERLLSAISLLEEIADDAGLNSDGDGGDGNPDDTGSGQQNEGKNIKDQLMDAMKNFIEEFKKEIKQGKQHEMPSEVEIDLESIESPSKSVDNNEIDIEPEQLKELISSAIKNQLYGGR